MENKRTTYLQKVQQLKDGRPTGQENEHRTGDEHLFDVLENAENQLKANDSLAQSHHQIDRRWRILLSAVLGIVVGQPAGGRRQTIRSGAILRFGGGHRSRQCVIVVFEIGQLSRAPLDDFDGVLQKVSLDWEERTCGWTESGRVRICWKVPNGGPQSTSFSRLVTTYHQSRERGNY